LKKEINKMTDTTSPLSFHKHTGESVEDARKRLESDPKTKVVVNEYETLKKEIEEAERKNQKNVVLGFRIPDEKGGYKFGKYYNKGSKEGGTEYVRDSFVATRSGVLAAMANASPTRKGTL